MTNGNSQRIVLYAEFTSTPGNEERIAHLVREYGELVRAEPGNVVFSTHRKRDNPAAFFVYEEYADRNAFSAHLAADYGARFNTSLAQFIVERRAELTFLRSL